MADTNMGQHLAVGDVHPAWGVGQTVKQQIDITLSHGFSFRGFGRPLFRPRKERGAEKGRGCARVIGRWQQLSKRSKRIAMQVGRRAFSLPGISRSSWRAYGRNR